MYSILIIDDEPYAVKALTETIDWETLQIDRVHSTCYIDEASEILTKENIDICLSDIVMPGKTGFDMIEFIKENNLKTKVIMTTAHEDFWYIKKALELGAVEYLLKPIQFDDLKKAVSSAITLVESENQKQQYMEKYRESCELWNNNIPDVIERFWRDALSGRFCLNKNKLEQFFRNIGKPITDSMKFCVLLISLEEWDDGVFDEDMLNYGVRNMAKETVADSFGGMVMEDDNGNNIGIIYCSSKTNESDIEKACQRLINYCSELMNIEVSCYLSNIVGVDGVIEEYQYIQHAYWNSFKKNSGIIRKEDCTDTESVSVRVPLFMNIDNPLEYMNGEHIIKELNAFFESHEQLSAETSALIYHGILFFIHDLCNKRGINTSSILNTAADKSVINSAKKMNKWCVDVINKFMLNVNSATQNDKISAVKKYIESNYMNQISRDTISNELFFNASYLSRLFKKSTGLSIFEYLAQVRIEEAKKLLIYTDKKISNIAMEVGYNHFSHFANVFRSITGLTPKDYRELNSK